jgi:hypothetical protein
LASGGKDRADVEKNLNFLKPYQIIVVRCGVTESNCSTAYATEKEVRARAALRFSRSEEVLPVDEVPPRISATVDTLKKLLAAKDDEGGSKAYILLFPAATKEGKLVADSSRRSKLTLVLKADESFQKAVFVWHTPFDATTPVPPCRKCKETVSAKWSYCPWCGAKLDNE